MVSCANILGLATRDIMELVNNKLFFFDQVMNDIKAGYKSVHNKPRKRKTYVVSMQKRKYKIRGSIPPLRRTHTKLELTFVVKKEK